MHQGGPLVLHSPLPDFASLSTAPSWKASAGVLSRSLFQCLRAFGVQALTDCGLFFKAERREGGRSTQTEPGLEKGTFLFPISMDSAPLPESKIRRSVSTPHPLSHSLSFCKVLESCPLPALTAKLCRSLSPAVGTGLVRKTHTCLPLRLQWGRSKCSFF